MVCCPGSLDQVAEYTANEAKIDARTTCLVTRFVVWCVVWGNRKKKKITPHILFLRDTQFYVVIINEKGSYAAAFRRTTTRWQPDK